MSGLLPLTGRELKKWYRNMVFFITGLLQPIFWIALFGSAFDIAKFLPTAALKNTFGTTSYITFIIGGVLTTTSLFTAMFSGTSIIFDRRLGNMARFLVSPIHRSSIVFAKVLSTTVRILVQAVILIGVAFIIPNGLILSNGMSLFGLFIISAALIMVAFSFSSIFSIIAIRLKRQETIFGIINLINLPLLFASYALFPPSFMPSWLRNVAAYNPVSWSSQAIRNVILNGTLTGSVLSTTLEYMLYLLLLTIFMLVLVYFVSEKEIRD
ncbi:MAG: ABC transporter permease [Candidatus Thermoplasmatota archaeon]|jgi:ABC-2 type transport system permease protein|nr:ABC transporter permease [Candidatus Thermoplasmatota archaeon]